MAVHLHTNRKFKHILSETLNVQFSSAAAKFLALFVGSLTRSGIYILHEGLITLHEGPGLHQVFDVFHFTQCYSLFELFL